MLMLFFCYIILRILYIIHQNAHQRTNVSTKYTGRMSYTPIQQTNILASSSAAALKRTTTSGISIG